jgi:hypothetical protein
MFQNTVWDKNDMLIPVRGLPRDPGNDHFQDEDEEFDYDGFDHIEDDFYDEDEAYIREQGYEEDPLEEISPEDEFLEERF